MKMVARFRKRKVILSAAKDLHLASAKKSRSFAALRMTS